MMELADVTDSKSHSSFPAEGAKKSLIEGVLRIEESRFSHFGLHFGLRFPEFFQRPIRKEGFCRNDGIGRRGGLKIRWANTPCGFESHFRHHETPVNTGVSSFLGLEYRVPDPLRSLSSFFRLSEFLMIDFPSDYAAFRFFGGHFGGHRLFPLCSVSREKADNRLC